MTSGIKRIKLTPYNIESAIDIVCRIGRRIAPGFVLTKEVHELYVILIQYFYADDNFPGELSKGLLLQGPTGTGKTLAFQVMSIFLGIERIRYIMNGKGYRMNYSIVNVNEVVNGFVNNGFEGINTYASRHIICLDDLGAELAQGMHYGNRLDVISYFISERYEKRLLTFATSNFPIDSLEKKYDDRVLSRLYTMFNFITVKGDDFRRK